jgi:hypothetical protein
MNIFYRQIFFLTIYRLRSGFLLILNTIMIQKITELQSGIKGAQLGDF